MKFDTSRSLKKKNPLKFSRALASQIRTRIRRRVRPSHGRASSAVTRPARRRRLETTPCRKSHGRFSIFTPKYKRAHNIGHERRVPPTPTPTRRRAFWNLVDVDILTHHRARGGPTRQNPGYLASVRPCVVYRRVRVRQDGHASSSSARNARTALASHDTPKASPPLSLFPPHGDRLDDGAGQDAGPAVRSLRRRRRRPQGNKRIPQRSSSVRRGGGGG
jgi:hypothetical protein